jgi:hypothetical protein
MSGMLVALAYGAAVIVALLLLYGFEPVPWYWHLLAFLAAMAIGLSPLPAAWHSPRNDALVGCAFLFLFTWAVCAPLFREFHRERHA